MAIWIFQELIYLNASSENAHILMHMCTNQRAFSAGSTLQQFTAPLPAPQASSFAQFAPQAPASIPQGPSFAQSQLPASGIAPNIAAASQASSGSGIAPGRTLSVAVASANKGPEQTVGQYKLINYLLGKNVAVHEFDANGYNSEGGGPVSSGEALSCDFDTRPCCWANIPPPDDQLDWQLASGAPQSSTLKNVPMLEGSYLVAYASNAAPSDEAQFASCAIGCASSPIVIRARHWQSENVLLQVCQRESFPSTVNYNPLLNCQEFPLVNGLATTELILPKASLIDIVFVASNFVGERGDIAILDNIEISYESDGEECAIDNVEENTAAVEENKRSSQQNKFVEINSHAAREEMPIKISASHSAVNQSFSQKASSSSNNLSQSTSGIHSSESRFDSSQNILENNHLFESNQRMLNAHAAGLKTVISSISPCRSAKCSFEDGSTCHYKDALQTQSIRGLTTRFQVVTGQFMNRVTGVKEGTEGDFYAATFLFPREMAGLAVELNNLTEAIRLRFQFYEGTHGVQLKGCCDSLDNCPFRSDKFVSISDRTWKLSDFTCAPGTTEIIFVCENTRTNQGACAIDDIQVIERATSDIRKATMLC
ncbi:unnamed protein product [Anisakis simplex]|uniref:MAM domain-containing protein n=1 Tax=Anisakis simplex TaxID=6269 RepID=A0A0M3JVR1_ANISI|nr:unnamed protein product [Anisakis simplex]